MGRGLANKEIPRSFIHNFPSPNPFRISLPNPRQDNFLPSQLSYLPQTTYFRDQISPRPATRKFANVNNSIVRNSEIIHRPDLPKPIQIFSPSNPILIVAPPTIPQPLSDKHQAPPNSKLQTRSALCLTGHNLLSLLYIHLREVEASPLLSQNHDSQPLFIQRQNGHRVPVRSQLGQDHRL